MLRDALTRLDGAVTWDCDELNLVWRHGNRAVPHDELTAEQARPDVRAYIRRRFRRLARRHGATHVVEKTCANSLRVPFVQAVIPEARWVFIVRDGRDAAASARRRWTAPLEVLYTLRKVRHAPATDLPFYLGGFAANYLKRRSSWNQLGTWGPRFQGMNEMLTSQPLLAVCSRQWERCVLAGHAGLCRLDPATVLTVSYEEFCRDPCSGLARIADHVGLPATSDDVKAAGGIVSTGNIQRSRHELTHEEIRLVEQTAQTGLRQFGYL